MNWGQANTGTGEFSFTQPIISTNGVVGGDSFAISTTATVDGSHYFWLAFDGNNSTYFRTKDGRNKDYIFYHPNGLKISSINFLMVQGSNEYFTAYNLYASDDNSTYTLLKSASGVSGTNQTIEVNATNFYKYYKFVPTSLYSSTYPNFSIDTITITATYISTALNTITFPYSHSNTNYSYSLSYLNGISGNSYVTKLTNSNLHLQNNSSAAVAYYSTIGY